MQENDDGFKSVEYIGNGSLVDETEDLNLYLNQVKETSSSRIGYVGNVCYKNRNSPLGTTIMFETEEQAILAGKKLLMKQQQRLDYLYLLRQENRDQE